MAQSVTELASKPDNLSLSSQDPHRKGEDLPILHRGIHSTRAHEALPATWKGPNPIPSTANSNNNFKTSNVNFKGFA